MELFGLKDSSGKEYKLIVPANESDQIGFTRAIAVEPKPEFKFELNKWYVLDKWYVGDTADIFYCDAISEGWAWSRDKRCHYDPDYSRHATPQEIEQHLRKICTDKGLMKNGVHLKSPRGYLFTFNKSHCVVYCKEHEAFYSGGMALYDEGKFAEIIPDKKRLPVTREEFATFLADFTNRGNYVTRHAFLDDYED